MNQQNNNGYNNNYNNYNGGYNNPQPPYGNQGQNPYQPNPYQQPVYQQVYQRPRNNGLGIAGFVLALCAWIFSWVPVVNLLTWILGLVFSFIGMFKAPRGLAIAGFVISVIGIVILVLALLFWGGLAALAVI